MLGAVQTRPPRHGTPSLRPIWAGLLALIALQVAFYVPMLWAGVGGDEEVMYLAETQRLPVATLVTTPLAKVWQQRHYTYDAYASSGDYRPVNYLVTAGLTRLFGGDPWGHQVVALAVAGAVTGLIWVVVTRLTADPWLALVTTAFMALEPSRLGYQSVIYTGGTVLLFLLLSLWLYLVARTVQRGRAWAYALSVLFAGLAMGSHELALGLPFLLLVIEGWGGIITHQWETRLSRLFPYGGLLVGYLGVRAWVMVPYPQDTGLLWPLTFPRLVTMGLQTLARLGLLVIPARINPLQVVKTWLVGEVPGQTLLAASWPMTVAAALGLIFLAGAAAVWGLTRQVHTWPRQVGLLAIAWVLVAVTIPLVVVNHVTIRHLAVAAIGASLLKALGLRAVAERWGRPVALGVLVVCLTWNGWIIWQGVTEAQIHGTRSRILSADVVRLIRMAADARPMRVYLLNAGGESAAAGLEEVVQAAIGRRDIEIIVPYILGWNGEDPHEATQVEVTPSMITITTRREPWVFLLHYAQERIRTGAQIRNGDRYTLTILEADDLRHNPRRLVIRYAQPLGTQLLFLVQHRDWVEEYGVRMDQPELHKALFGQMKKINGL